MKHLPVLLAIVVSLTTCSRTQEPVLDQATVVANNASVRLKNSSTSRTLQTLDAGDRVEILEKQDNWYRIRYEGRLEGWMEESTLVTRQTENRIKDLVALSLGQTTQNTAVLREEANFRIEPGRHTPVIRKLDAGTRVEVLDRVTLPRPGSGTAMDVWIKVRPSPVEVGWLYSGLMEFDVPVEIAQYTEGRTYTTVQKLNQVQDPIAGPINWYVVGERSPGLNPHLDFDGIRVFTWNLRLHRYETAFRTRGLKGVYPLEAAQRGSEPMFRVFELQQDGSTKVPREFVLNGVVVREVKPIS